MAVALSNVFLKNVKPGETRMAREINRMDGVDLAALGDSRHADGLGLYLFVQGSRRRWVFRYTFPRGGSVREMGLGAFPRVTRRRRTGLNVQMNLKVTSEVAEQFTATADEYGLVFGELLEHALIAFRKRRKAPKSRAAL